MNDQQREWLLQALAHTSADATENLLCEAARDQLGLYIEAEMHQEDAQQRFPQLFNHLHVCPECREIYELLRETLIDNADLLVDPEPIEQTTVPAPASRPVTLAEAVNWAREQLQLWQQTLQGRALVYRSSAPEAGEPQSIAIPGFNETRITMSLAVDGSQWQISGAIVPENPVLQGVALRLYALSGLPSARSIAAVIEATVDDFDTFSFAPVAIGQYVLTIALPEGEVGLTFIGGPGASAT
jgi:hypothetical protein